MVGGKGQHVYEAAGGVHHGEKPDNDVSDHHIEHEVGDAEAGVLIAKEVHFSAEPFQNQSTPDIFVTVMPPGFCINALMIPFFGINVYE